MKRRDIRCHRGAVSRADRELRHKHKACAIWFTGLSGSGKSTLAHEIERLLHEKGVHAYVFDGDNVRTGLCNDLGFSNGCRQENTRRIAETAKLYVDAGMIALCAFIAPTREMREGIKDILGDDYHEVHVSCPLRVCEERDIKGYYTKARKGEIQNYTGISSPYEVPDNADIVVDTDKQSLDESAKIVLDYILKTIQL